jgi:hypothetical protein
MTKSDFDGLSFKICGEGSEYKAKLEPRILVAEMDVQEGIELNSKAL